MIAGGCHFVFFSDRLIEILEKTDQSNVIAPRESCRFMQPPQNGQFWARSIIVLVGCQSQDLEVAFLPWLLLVINHLQIFPVLSVPYAVA